MGHRREPCYDRRMMPRPLRALASIIVGITTIFGIMVYQHYSREPPTDAFAAAVTMAATILAWMVTGWNKAGGFNGSAARKAILA